MEKLSKNKYILIGIPHCGKSTLGRQAADILRLPFFDTDLMTCERLGMNNPFDPIRATINGSIITAQREALCELAVLDSSAIIATGAEIALMPGCAVLLRRMGTVIHIQRKQETVLEEMANDDKVHLVWRNVTDGTEIVMREESVKLYAQELSRYEALADLTLDNNGSEDIGVEKLIALIKQK